MSLRPVLCERDILLLLQGAVEQARRRGESFLLVRATPDPRCSERLGRAEQQFIGQALSEHLGSDARVGVFGERELLGVIPAAAISVARREPPRGRLHAEFRGAERAWSLTTAIFPTDGSDAAELLVASAKPRSAIHGIRRRG